MRTIIVDDEPLARKRLARLLAEHPQVEIVGQAGNGQEACTLIDTARPELVFLDVQMPGMNGFDVLSRIEQRPHVIFVTAHDEFAVRAFEEQAMDYLLKPVEPQRLTRALERVQAVAPSTVDDRLERLLQAVERATPAVRRIPVRKGSKVILVEPDAITFCRAEDKYAVLYTSAGEHIVDRTIDELEATLDPGKFLRVHRSTIVNLAAVRELTSIEGGRYVIVLNSPSPTQVYASRAGAKALRERLGI